MLARRMSIPTTAINLWIGTRYSSVWYVSHDDEYLYFCAENAISDYDKRFYALYIDTDLGKELHAEGRSRFLHESYFQELRQRMGQQCRQVHKDPRLISPEPESCDGSTAVKLANWKLFQAL